MLSLSALIVLILAVLAQPVSSSSSSAQFTPFTYPPNAEPTYAKSNTGPVPSKTYAPAYTEVSLLLGPLSTTTWGSWNPNATNTATDTDDPYGQYAWTQLWVEADIFNFSSTGLYSTTVEPTPIPTESLVLPPPDAFSFADDLKFPEDFVFGVASLASQIEGAVAEEGRTPTIQEKLIFNNQPQDYVTNENYYLYKQDIVRLAAMGVKHYSFLIAWSRILPFAVPGSPVNQQGIDHYDDLINTCLQYGITPMATLTHFDTPLQFNGGKNILHMPDYPLLSYGGYANASFNDAFINYGKIVLAHYADRVPIWVGFNEPYVQAGYPAGIKNVILATAELHDFYHNQLNATGKFGIKLNDNFGVPKDPSNPEDVRAAERYNDFFLASMGNPLFLGQDYPELWTDTFSNYSDFRLSSDEIAKVRGGSDFLGVDPYTCLIITATDGGLDQCANNRTNPAWPQCVNATSTRADGWAIGYRLQSYVYITPEQHRLYLKYLWNTFQTPIMVTEFGFPAFREFEKDLKDQLFDLERSIYYRSFMDATLKAIHYDNVNVMGALAWAAADDWEFGIYTLQYGLQVVNRTTQERYYKKSFFDVMKYVQDRL